MKKIIVAIDGYSGTGKSSTARAVAARLGYRYIDSGAMYRAVTCFFMERRTDLSSVQQVQDALQQVEIDFQINPEGRLELLLNGEWAESRIRSNEVNANVSIVAAMPEVRRRMVHLQQAFGKGKAIVMDGRDIGTVVFPEAELKVFMTAEVRVRALRRKKEMEKAGLRADLEEVEANLLARDHKDTTRADSPLLKASDAVEIDTTDLTLDEQVDKIVNLAEELIRS